MLTIHEKIKKHLFIGMYSESMTWNPIISVFASKFCSPLSSLVLAYIKKKEIEIQENPTVIFV